MSFNLDNYEDVNSRNIRVLGEYPTRRIIPIIEDIDLIAGYILVRVEVYAKYEDDKPTVINYAFEQKATHGVNANFYIENAITSAIGRALGLLSPSATISTKQDMQKVTRLQAVKPVVDKVEWDIEPFNAVGEDPYTGYTSPNPACEHGVMTELLGKAKEPPHRPYMGFKCPDKVKDCQTVWFRQSGKDWLSPADYADVLQDKGN